MAEKIIFKVRAIMHVVKAIKEDGYVKVNDMTEFLNGVYGRSIVTGQRINDLLVKLNLLHKPYPEDNMLLERWGETTMTYYPFEWAEQYCKTTCAIGFEDKPYLIWKARFLINIFRINFCDEIDDREIVHTMIGAYYNLMGQENYYLDEDVIVSNYKNLKKILKEWDNNE